MEYIPDLRYFAGKDQTVADYLSRIPSPGKRGVSGIPPPGNDRVARRDKTSSTRRASDEEGSENEDNNNGEWEHPN